MGRENPQYSQTELITLELKKVHELGELFNLAYLHALSEYPELSKVNVEISNVEKYSVLMKTGGFARHQSETKDGKPLVVVRGDSGVEHYKKLMIIRKVSAEMCAEDIGIPLEKLTPKILATFIFLHELGHAYDYLVNMPETKDYRAKRESELKSLPISGYNPAKASSCFDSEESDLSKWYDTNKEVIAKNGYNSKLELLESNERAYHLLSTERFPDNFATGIIKKNIKEFFPELII